VKLWSKCCHLFIIDCIESKLRTLAPRRCTVIYCHQHVMGFVMIYYVVYNSLRDLNINEFDLKLKELLMHMKCQILEVYVLFISFVNGFDKGK
jgi:SUMO ligase MMS21 Smc5/6 complex component